ncbi:MAG: aa3-type cytochrome c oxidase subunit IV [Rhizobiaceae bacterium]|nr:aa3-type cytochrome c oxidase subunit IV [Rhizobiaceae bacterium]
MADHTPAGPLETGAAMDYSEHDKTYSMFLGLAKWCSLVVAAILIAMAFGFFTSAGFFSATILFILICAVGGFLLR